MPIFKDENAPADLNVLCPSFPQVIPYFFTLSSLINHSNLFIIFSSETGDEVARFLTEEDAMSDHFTHQPPTPASRVSRPSNHTFRPTSIPISASTLAPSSIPTSIPTSASTLAPTSAPTSASSPTPHPTMASRSAVVFNVTQTLNNVADASNIKDKDVFEHVIIETVAEVAKLYEDEVRVLRVEPLTKPQQGVKEDDKYTVEVVYENEVWLLEGNDYTSPEEAYKNTMDLIDQSVTDDNFTKILEHYASVEKCAALENATATSEPQASNYITVVAYTEEVNKFEVDAIFLVTLMVPSIFVIVAGALVYNRLLKTDREAAANDKWFKPSVNKGNGRSESVNPLAQKNNLSEKLLA